MPYTVSVTAAGRFQVCFRGDPMPNFVYDDLDSAFEFAHRFNKAAGMSDRKKNATSPGIEVPAMFSAADTADTAGAIARKRWGTVRIHRGHTSGPYVWTKARETGFELLYRYGPIDGGLYVKSHRVAVAVEKALNDAYRNGFNVSAAAFARTEGDA